MNSEEIKEKLFSSESEEIINVLIKLNEEHIEDDEIIKEVFKLFRYTKNDMEKELIIDYFKKINKEWLNKEFIKLFASTSAFLRNASMDILRKKGEEVMDLLIESMNSSDKDIRKFTIDTAYQIESLKTNEVLKKGLNDSDINVVITTVEYIGKLNITNFKEEVLSLFLNSKNPFLKVVCLETLSIIGDKDILLRLKELVQLNNNVDKLLLFPFLKIIGNFGSPEDLVFLANALDSLHITYLKEITNAMEHIVRNNEFNVLNKNVYLKIESLIFKDINSINKYGLITFLGNFENKQLKETVKKCLEMDDRMLIIGCLEIIGTKGFENEFSDELNKVKVKYKNDDEINEIIEDILYLTGD